MRQRLIEQDDARLLDDCAADGDALPLSARQRRGPAVEQIADLQQFGHLPDFCAIFALGVLLRSSEKPIFSATVMCG